ncbi:hypothetical protein At12D13_17500 [Agrobacterium fabrum]|nr:hypothetical protein At12D13_17500 [Agrobacterium fabrum]
MSSNPFCETSLCASDLEKSRRLMEEHLRRPVRPGSLHRSITLRDTNLQPVVDFMLWPRDQSSANFHRFREVAFFDQQVAL